MGKKWVIAVAGLVGAAGLVVFSRRASAGDEPVRAAVVRRREAPRRADVRRVGARRVHRTAPVVRRCGVAARR
jgi:hypothetical protein